MKRRKRKKRLVDVLTFKVSFSNKYGATKLFPTIEETSCKRYMSVMDANKNK